ncbi:Neural cell adhesion molecule L1.1 [Triplophysa tibetana]|uniref:Neural cell adhesion molecule L1 n=1 Tax=Triplophysa tibetana TaxID=1572043 RepID=A0A5A9NEU7_9TELE|nr:Neural cell adhesion molecule L1.1 [Triplophysa tibetana]
MSPVYRQPFLHLLLLFLFVGRIVAYIQIPPDFKQLPKITSQPVSQTAFSLDDVNLICEASGNPKPTFRWVKDGRPFGDVLHDSGNLTVKRTEELSVYQGTYRCHATNDLGTAVSDLVHLMTESVPTLAKEKGQKKLQFEEGASTMLACNPPKSSITPKIHWMDKDFHHILLSERVTTALDGNLYFANLLLTDSRDDYTCNAHYLNASIILPKEPIAFTVTPSNSVVKNRAPQMKQPAGDHSSYLILKGQTLTLECIPDGLPTPSVEWDRKDYPLSLSPAKKLNFNHRFQIESVSEADDGEYACTARNSHGSITHYYTVTVEAAPYWTKKPEDHLYTRGETIKLDCQAEGIPTPNITWRINGDPYTGTDLDQRVRVSSGSLIVDNAQYNHTGVYQCEATNKHGHILINTHVHVVVLPPQILTEDVKVYTVMVGTTAELECRTFGSPRPNVDWMIPDSSLAQSHPKMSQMTNGNLKITDVSEEESGVYKCSVRESRLTITAELRVFNRTIIVAPTQDLQVIRGKDALIQCKYRWDTRLKPPTIQWKKDGQKISASKYSQDDVEGSLKVMDVQMKDSGVYSCEIITEWDSVEAIGFITVQGKAVNTHTAANKCCSISSQPYQCLWFSSDKPDAPASVAMSEKKQRSVTLSWMAGYENNSPVSEFVIEMMEDENAAEGTWKEYERVPQDIRHLEVHLQPYCKYSFRVRAVNAIGTSNASQPSEPYSTPSAKPDVNPENVTSVSTDPNSMIITWKELERRQFNGPGFKYKVSWRKASGMGPQWKESIVSGPPFVVKDTGTFVPFEIKVEAVNNIGEGPEPVAKLGHSGEDTPLEAPSEVMVELVSNKSGDIIVRWRPVSRESVRGHLLGYKSREHDRDDNRRVVKVYGNKEEEVVSGLHFYTDYILTVAAFNSKGEGPHSELHHFRTPEGAPGPPSHLTFESPSETEITLHWEAPHKPNGVLTGYLLQYREIKDKISPPVESINLPISSQYRVGRLNPQSRYQFNLSAQNSAGYGEPIKKEGETMLDGEPPSKLYILTDVKSVNLSWVPGDRQRNVPFSFRYQRNVSGSEWEESEQVNSSTAFFQLQGLQPETSYHLQIQSGNTTHEWTFQTIKPVMGEIASGEIASGFATQAWFIGLISAVVLLLLVLLILCFIKRSKGGKYSVKDKEECQAEPGVRSMKDDAFGEYSDNEDKRSIIQPSVSESKRNSNDSLADYGDSVDIQFNEDGSFIGQYSGRRDPQSRGGHESSGATSPMNPNMPAPSKSFPNSVSGILGPN